MGRLQEGNPSACAADVAGRLRAGVAAVPGPGEAGVAPRAGTAGEGASLAVGRATTVEGGWEGRRSALPAEARVSLRGRRLFAE